MLERGYFIEIQELMILELFDPDITKLNSVTVILEHDRPWLLGRQVGPVRLQVLRGMEELLVIVD